MDYDSSRHRLAPGTRIGDHLIVRGVLGEGGTAVVYEALHTRLGASVALKVVDVSEEYMEGARARLLREAQVCASLEDPHVPRVYDVGELEDGTPYVVMERVSGRTLENVLSQGALPLDIAVHITEDLLHAVEAIEKAGIVHRDIKPPNIILQGSAEGTLRVRLMDFGVSKTVEASADPGLHSQSNPKLTQQGAIVGTPHYMAPEQIVGPSVDSRADLYAVGVVAYEMMGGRTPFEGQTTGEVVAAVLHTRPLPLRKLREVHSELEEWVEKAMAPRRADRFSSARVMREELREAWAVHQAYVQAAGRRTWARRARVIGGLGLVAVGLTLPLPAGYDLTALSKLLTGGSAAPVEPAAAAAMPGLPEQAPTNNEQVQGTDMAVGVSTPAWDLNGAEAYRAPQAQQPEALADEAALPQSEPRRGEEAPNVAPPASPRSFANKRGPALPAKIMRPQAPAPNVRTPLAMPRAMPVEPAPASSGMLLNEYLRQLDSQLQMTPLRDLSGPAAEQRPAAAPERLDGEPAPNPFEPLPANPYQQ